MGRTFSSSLSGICADSCSAVSMYTCNICEIKITILCCTQNKKYVDLCGRGGKWKEDMKEKRRPLHSFKYGT
jgi:hypothetical protein